MKRHFKITIIGLLTVAFLFFCYKKVEKFMSIDSCLDQGGRWNYETNECDLSKTHEPIVRSDTDNYHGYNELANPDKRKSFTISDFNTDNQEIKNIDRPNTSETKSSIDTSLLYAIWTSDPSGPHADFVFSSKSFYVVDYDGDGNMPYILNNKKLKIYYNDFIQEGEIVSVDKDTLKIKWKDSDETNIYIKWVN